MLKSWFSLWAMGVQPSWGPLGALRPHLSIAWPENWSMYSGNLSAGVWWLLLGALTPCTASLLWAAQE